MDLSESPFKKVPSYHEKLSSYDHEIRFLIPHLLAGALIGKRGVVITRLRSQHPHAAIRVPESTTPERVVDIWSPSITDALKMFHDAVDTLQSDLSMRQIHGLREDLEIHMLCREGQLEAISTANGDKWVEDLARANHLQIKVYAQCAPASSERIASLYGCPANIARAVSVIMNLTSEVPMNSNPYNANDWIEQLCPEYGGFIQGQNTLKQSSGRRSPPRCGFAPPEFSRQDVSLTPNIPLPTPPPRGISYDHGIPPGCAFDSKAVSIEYTVPEIYVGALIGRRGETIETIRHGSGATVTIHENYDRRCDRLITISGTQGQVDEATVQLQAVALEEDEMLENRRRR